jgi:hypothetical protein
MKKSKSFIESKTIIGAIVVLLATVIPAIFPSVTGAELQEVVQQLTIVIGALVSIYGRIVADTKIR